MAVRNLNSHIIFYILVYCVVKVMSDCSFCSFSDSLDLSGDTMEFLGIEADELSNIGNNNNTMPDNNDENTQDKTKDLHALILNLARKNKKLTRKVANFPKIIQQVYKNAVVAKPPPAAHLNPYPQEKIIFVKQDQSSQSSSSESKSSSENRSESSENSSTSVSGSKSKQTNRKRKRISLESEGRRQGSQRRPPDIPPDFPPNYRSNFDTTSHGHSLRNNKYHPNMDTSQRRREVGENTRFSRKGFIPNKDNTLDFRLTRGDHGPGLYSREHNACSRRHCSNQEYTSKHGGHPRERLQSRYKRRFSGNKYEMMRQNNNLKGKRRNHSPPHSMRFSRHKYSH